MHDWDLYKGLCKEGKTIAQGFTCILGWWQTFAVALAGWDLKILKLVISNAIFENGKGKLEQTETPFSCDEGRRNLSVWRVSYPQYLPVLGKGVFTCHPCSYIIQLYTLVICC